MPQYSIENHRFTLDDFRALNVCKSGLQRVAAFGGAIENTPEGWQAYIDANPIAWRAPLFTAWQLQRLNVLACPGLIWRVARIAFREQPERNAALRVYAETLGPHNWRTARKAADAADAAEAAEAAIAAADAAADAAAYVADAAADAAADAQSRVKAEIIAMAVAALSALNTERK